MSEPRELPRALPFATNTYLKGAACAVDSDLSEPGIYHNYATSLSEGSDATLQVCTASQARDPMILGFCCEPSGP